MKIYIITPFVNSYFTSESSALDALKDYMEKLSRALCNALYDKIDKKLEETILSYDFSSLKNCISFIKHPSIINIIPYLKTDEDKVFKNIEHNGCLFNVNIHWIYTHEVVDRFGEPEYYVAASPRISIIESETDQLLI
jgi:DNA-directed RNA polymerase subunit L